MYVYMCTQMIVLESDFIEVAIHVYMFTVFEADIAEVDMYECIYDTDIPC